MNLQRLLVERIDQRILVGILSFLGIIVLVGWIAINEGGRMQAFERQYSARSIERGAALFNTNCSACHGVTGLGSPRAPALNSPYLFGHDFIPEINVQRRSLLQQQPALNTEVSDLSTEQENPETTEQRSGEIEARLAEINTQLGDITTQLAELDAEQVPFNTDIQAAIDKGYDPSAPSRLENLGWTGGLHNFIYTTLVHGRPTSGAYFPQPMPAWSQLAGGPLRADQLEDLTAYILNWDKGDNWAVEDLLAVQQFPIVPGAEIEAVEGAVCESQDDCTALTGPDIMPQLEGLAGDPQEGQTLYNTSLACVSCHTTGIGPALEGTWTRVEEERLQEPEFEGYTGEEYLAESIINPLHYVVPDFQPVMPQTFGLRITDQQLADLIAYLMSQDQPVE